MGGEALAFIPSTNKGGYPAPTEWGCSVRPFTVLSSLNDVWASITRGYSAICVRGRALKYRMGTDREKTR